VRLISLSDLKVERTSAVTLASASGFFSKRYVTPDRRVAVVSEPAVTIKLAVRCRIPKSSF